MAVLSMPETTVDHLANEAVLSSVLPHTVRKLSIVLRSSRNDDNNRPPPTLAQLRRYTSEVYSQLWDVCFSSSSAPGTSEDQLLDVCVYPSNLPNTAPESLLAIQADLQAVCALDSATGWTSVTSTRSVPSKGDEEPEGGLAQHVAALNQERSGRGLRPVMALPVQGTWAGDPPDFEDVLFLDDDDLATGKSAEEGKRNLDLPKSSMLLGGTRLPTNQQLLYESVAVGGTFDGLHFGHRKLLTLAVSSVNPRTGKLLVGVTEDHMLKHKQLAQYLPLFDERSKSVRKFLHRLAPGLSNRISIVPISDAFGPPGDKDQGAKFDALVLSHETLDTGRQLNQHRVENLGIPPLALLCTRRTEAVGMSSTALRKMRSTKTSSSVRALDRERL